MTSYQEVGILLDDLEKYAETHDFPEAESLILKAKEAIEKDLGVAFPPVRKSSDFSLIRLIQ